jgi:GNAT superfamily N-acetyltransferase
VTSVPGPAAAASFPIRPATHADVDAMTDALTTAFFNDPVWGPVFPDESRRAAQSAVMWRVYATSALRYPWTFVTPGAEAAAIWIPPGGVELTDEEEHGLAGLLEEAAGPEVAAAAGEVDARLVAASPAEPCFHLTIIATHTAHRGRGLGMGLLAATLSRIDALGAPAYLESTNPANDKRYQRVGFEPRGEIVMPAGQIVTTMWRSPRPA